MVLSTWQVVLFAVACFLTSGRLGSNRQLLVAPKEETISPRWRVDTRLFVGSKPLGLIVGRGHETHGEPHMSLYFVDDNTLVLSSVARSGEANLASRSSLQDGALRLHVILVDAISGKIRNDFTLPTGTRFAGVVATFGGNLVIQRGPDLTVYSPLGTELSHLKLPPLQEGEWHPHVSPSGKHILFVATNLTTNTPVPWIWIMTQNLTMLRSWEEPQTGPVSVSDQAITMTTCIWLSDCEHKLEVKDIFGSWKTVFTFNIDQKPYPYFLSDNLLVVQYSPTGITIIRPTGEVVSGQDLDAASKGYAWRGAVSSLAGNRFLMPGATIKGASHAFDVSGRGILKCFLIYDSPYKSPSYLLHLRSDIPETVTLFALSPNGLSLAVQNRDTLTVVDLPATD